MRAVDGEELDRIAFDGSEISEKLLELGIGLVSVVDGSILVEFNFFGRGFGFDLFGCNHILTVFCAFHSLKLTVS